MKSNRDLLQGLTILNTVLFFTFTEYSTPFSNLPLHVRVREVVGSTRPCTVSSARFIQLLE